MTVFKADQPLEARLKHIRTIERVMNVAQMVFLSLAALHLLGIKAILPSDLIAFIFAFVAIFQFFLVRFIFVPSWTKTAHKNLPK